MELTEQQQADKFHNRRKMAWRSWWLLTLVGIGLIGFSLSSDEAAARVAASAWVIGVVGGVWASIVLSYFGAASLSDWRTQ